MGCEFVGCAMSGEEGDGHAVVLEDCDGRRWVSPWGRGIDCCDRLVAIKLLEPGAPDYGDVNGS